MTSKARTHTIIGLLLLIALVIGACDSQISDPETSIHNKANERITEGAPAFEDQLGDGCLRWRDSEDFSAFRKTADQPDWPTCKEVREQRKQKIETTFNALKALYRATTTNSSEWLTNRGWDTTNVPTSMEAFNDWYGLTVVGGDLTGLTLDIDLTEPLPPEIGNLTNLEDLSLSSNQLTGRLPQGLVGATEMHTLSFFNNAGLCAPANTEFQTWLNGISAVSGPTCSN